MLHYFCAQQTIRSNACYHQYHITAQARKNKSYQVPHVVQLTGKSQQKPAGGHMDAVGIAPEDQKHILSNTDVARSVTWHPVSIIKSTSTPSAHPVRNHGAAEPTAPTTIASPLSLSMDVWWGIHAVSSAQPIILQISWLPGVLHRLASGRRIGESPHIRMFY